MDNTQNSDITNLLMAIESSFNISPWLFGSCNHTITHHEKSTCTTSIIRKTLLGGIFAIIFQPHLIIELSGIDSNFYHASYVSIINAMGSKTSINTSNEMINDLLSSGGMYGMLNTIWLIICAMCFGGVMEASGALKKISQSIIQYAESTGSVIATTACTCLFFNVTASDQYLIL